MPQIPLRASQAVASKPLPHRAAEQSSNRAAKPPPRHTQKIRELASARRGLASTTLAFVRGDFSTQVSPLPVNTRHDHSRSSDRKRQHATLAREKKLRAAAENPPSPVQNRYSEMSELGGSRGSAVICSWWRRRELNRAGARVFSNLYATLRLARLGKLPCPRNRVRISYAKPNVLGDYPRQSQVASSIISIGEQQSSQARTRESQLRSRSALELQKPLPPSRPLTLQQDRGRQKR
jgi:hypothetical protein